MLPRIPTSTPPTPLIRQVLETFAHAAARETATAVVAILSDEARALIHRFKLKYDLYLDTTPKETSENADEKTDQNPENKDEKTDQNTN